MANRSVLECKYCGKPLPEREMANLHMLVCAANPINREHTPGPWKVDMPQYGHNYKVRDSHLNTVADCSFLSGRLPECGAEREANACLIAAAPDLLEVCEEVGCICTSWGGKFNTEYDHQPLCYKIQAAIAKAKGSDQ